MPRTLLVPLDGSELSEAALPWAAALARQRGLPLTLAQVVAYPSFGGGAWPEETMSLEVYEQVLEAEDETARTYLEGVGQRLAETGLHVETVVRHGSPSVALLDLADELNAEAIVIASHGHGGFKRFVLGSVAMQLVSHTSVPVLVVRAAAPEERHAPALQRLLVPLDGSVLAERALDVARETAPEATLVLVRIASGSQSAALEGASERTRDANTSAYGLALASSYLDRIAAPLRAAGVAVEVQAIPAETSGSVSRHLADAAAASNVDAIVMSTHGRGGVTGWLLGSVADEVVRNADRPVLLVSARALAARASGQVSVGDVMTRDVMTLQEDETLVVALRKLVRRQASGAPVLDSAGRLVGVISQRDIMGWHERAVESLARQLVPGHDEYLRRLGTEQVRTVMTTSPTSVPESASLATALALLRERGIRRLPVTRDGRVVGILTGTDVLLAMLASVDAASDEQHRAELQSSADERSGGSQKP